MQHKFRVFVICATGIFVTVFDTSAAIVALPTIATEFGADLSVAQWVLISNNLTIAALLVPAGRLSDMIGRKLIYVSGCAVFAAGVAFSALAESIGWLIFARCVVGLGSAMTQGTAMAILVGNFPPAERGRMLGLQLGAVGLGSIAGPALGGLIVGTIGWRMLFWLGVAAMLIIAAAGQRVLRRRPRRPDVPPFDFAGAALFSCIFVASLLTLTLAPRGALSNAELAIAGCIIVLMCALFVAVERRHSNPMLDFRLFRSSAFSLGAIAAVALFMCTSATRFLTPFYLQGVKGFDPSQVGALMMPAAIVTAVAAPFAGRLADRFGVRLYANIGFSIAIVGVLIYGTIYPETATWVIVVGLMILALGMAVFAAPNSAAILNSVAADAHGVASGFVNLCRNSGNVIGIAFAGALVTWTMGTEGYPPSLSEVRESAASGLFDAFSLGLRSVCHALLFVMIPVLAVVAGWAAVRSRRVTGTGESGDSDRS